MVRHRLLMRRRIICAIRTIRIGAERVAGMVCVRAPQESVADRHRRELVIVPWIAGPVLSAGTEPARSGKVARTVLPIVVYARVQRAETVLVRLG